ncbi:peptidoglycan editing factor PgeF [bacterium]|nr:peptidoglycan editing factor PgeF [bacterium]
MYYFEEYKGKNILRSDYIQEVNAFFTTRQGFDFDLEKARRVVSPTQTHTSNVQIVDDRTEYPDTDGLITDLKDCLVYLRFADCTPLIFYDNVKKVGAISHAGWRGTADKIGVKTVDKMTVNYGSKPKDITVLIGPAISVCCYEVGDDVKEKLLSTVSDQTGLTNGMNVDLKNINARQLEEKGVKKIDICPYCTCCNNDLFFSYRKENGTKERHYAVLKL